MNQDDRDKLIEVWTDVKHIKDSIPPLVVKIEKHDKFITIMGAVLFAIGSTFIALISGGANWIDKLFPPR